MSTDKSSYNEVSDHPLCAYQYCACTCRSRTISHIFPFLEYVHVFWTTCPFLLAILAQVYIILLEDLIGVKVIPKSLTNNPNACEFQSPTTPRLSTEGEVRRWSGDSFLWQFSLTQKQSSRITCFRQLTGRRQSTCRHRELLKRYSTMLMSTPCYVHGLVDSREHCM